MDRRTFLKSGIATATVVAGVGYSEVTLRRFAMAAEKKRVPVALQIYSVREAAQKDLKDTLKKIAAIGYDGVEFALGYYGVDPKEIRKMLDDFGLKGAGSLTDLVEFRNDFNKQIDINKTLGCPFMIVPSLFPRVQHQVASNEKIADEFSAMSEKAKAAGLSFGYHAHAVDAQDVEGMTAWTRLFSKGSKDLVAQMDVGNFIHGGGDPYAEIARFPGQAKTIHVKDLKEGGNFEATIGSGVVDWDKIFNLCETTGGTEWYVVEYERTPNEFEGVTASFEYLKSKGKTK